MRVAALALAALVVAGCYGPAAQPPAPFDGDAALTFVKGLALQPDGSPRFRMPGTPGQADGAAYLWQAIDVPGWSRGWQNFTGQDYLGLDRHSVEGYGPGSIYCPKADEKALPAWPFHNVYATHASARAGAPTILLAAHWDSQMHSDYDGNASRRQWPDPGANDGASGVGVLLQLMRQLPGDLPFNVAVLMVDGEDGFFDCYPIAGALMFAQHPPIAVQRFVLLDMVGDPGALFPRETNSAEADPTLVELLWSHGRRIAPQHFINRTVPIDDDHLAFIAAGIPSVDLIDAGRDSTFPPQWDTSGDTVDKLSAATLAAVGQTLMDTLRDPAMAKLMG